MDRYECLTCYATFTIDTHGDVTDSVNYCPCCGSMDVRFMDDGDAGG